MKTTLSTSSSDIQAAFGEGLLSRDHIVQVGGEWRLLGGQCAGCKTSMFPISPICHKCWSDRVERVELASRGTLYAYSTVHVGPTPWMLPYTLGYVDLPSDVRVLAHIKAEPASRLAIGAEVEVGIGTVAIVDGVAVEDFVFNVAN
jgi:uncharacterized OB-fold protein